MPGYIIHLTEAKMIVEQLKKSGYHLTQDWQNSFYLGALLPDTRRKGDKITSHFWHPDTLDDLAIPPDMNLFLQKYGKKMRGPLMLGYYAHLKLDQLYVKEFWKKLFIFLDATGSIAVKKSDITHVLIRKTCQRIPVENFFSREYYYGDYTRLNKPLRTKYQISPPLYPGTKAPECPIEEVRFSDLKGVLQELSEILYMEEEHYKEPLRILDQLTLETFIEKVALETCEFIKDHIYLLAMDLDGTLLPADKKLTPLSKQVLSDSIANGDQVIIASGRPFASLPEDVMAVPDLSYAIASNGASVYDCSHSEAYYQHSIDVQDNKNRIIHNCLAPESAKAIMDLIRFKTGDACPGMEVIINGTPYGPLDYVSNPQNYGLQGMGIIYIKTTRTPVEDIYAFVTDHIEDLEAIDIITYPPDEKEQWLKDLSSIPGLYITSSISHLIEISSSCSGKGAALRNLTLSMGHSPKNIIAFGNEENDRDMLEYAGIGVAVSNSSPSLLAIADHIAASNDEDGVARFLQSFFNE